MEIKLFFKCSSSFQTKNKDKAVMAEKQKPVKTMRHHLKPRKQQLRINSGKQPEFTEKSKGVSDGQGPIMNVRWILKQNL
jgi:hypothetical protein